MTVGIRADWCIALRMIALQELHHRQAEIAAEIVQELFSQWLANDILALGEPNEHS